MANDTAISAIGDLIMDAEHLVSDAEAMREAIEAGSPVPDGDLDRLESLARLVANHAPDVRWSLSQ